MSRNFEILQQTKQEPDLFRTSATPSAIRHNITPGRTHEELTKLVQRVFLSTGISLPRVVVFSAAERGNGCSWICARTGEILSSQTEGPVCLVDANLRTPALHKSLSVTSRGNLHLLPCARFSSDTNQLLSPDRLQERISELKAEFNYILIDAPPVNLYADAVVLGRMSDGLVMVLEANATRRETARKAKESLEAAGVPLLGAVLNKRTYPIPSFLYNRF